MSLVESFLSFDFLEARPFFRYNMANSDTWTVFERDEGFDAIDESMEAEFYRPLATFPTEPDPATITRLINDDVRKQMTTLPI